METTIKMEIRFPDLCTKIKSSENKNIKQRDAESSSQLIPLPEYKHPLDS